MKNLQRRGTKRIDHEMDIGEEYVEQFCPVEEPLKSTRFFDESDQTELARVEL